MDSISLDTFDIVAVNCTAEYLAIKVGSHGAALGLARALRSDVLVSSTRWTCAGHHIMRRLCSDGDVKQHVWVTIEDTEEAYHHDFLRHADVVFKTNMLSPKPLHQHPENTINAWLSVKYS